MRCLTRYVLSEFVKVFVVGIAAMTILVVLGVVAQEAIRRGLGLENLVRLVPYTLPNALLYAIPATTLFATCSVFGRIASANEVVAVKSMGVSPMALIWPTLSLSFLVSLLVVGLNDVAVTWGRDGANRVFLESIEQIAYGMLRTRRSYSCKSFSINVKSVEGNKLIRPTFTFSGSRDSSPFIFTAEQAIMEADLKQNSLRIELTNWEVEGADRMRMVWPDTYEIFIPLEEAAHKGGAARRHADIALRDINQAVKNQLNEIERRQQSQAAEAAYQMMTGDFAGLASPEWRKRQADRVTSQGQLHRLRTEPWRRWANGFSCFAFVLVGAPMAIKLRNSDVWTSFAACFMPILAVYYPLLAYGVGQAKSGTLPPYTVWLGNLVMTGVGFLLIKLVMRN
jgi:lipopolysaccharide export system permease protein